MAEQSKENLDLGKEKEKKPLNIMLVVVIVLIVLVLGMGGALLYMLGVFGGKPHVATQEAAHAEAPPPPPPKIPTYVALDKDLIVNLPAGGEARLFQIGISILVYDPQVEAAIKKHMPMLRNNINLLLAGQDAVTLKKPEGKLALQTQILAEINKVVKTQLPEAAAEQVFFTSFILQ
ncbi:MAG: flagellar basal body-associated FliL family protein [Methylococcaceae bacterium]|nr:MAG: flagellar basal body-associated FliL family protein [Methylococcaceae bacterium]